MVEVAAFFQLGGGGGFVAVAAAAAVVFSAWQQHGGNKHCGNSVRIAVLAAASSWRGQQSGRGSAAVAWQ